MLVGRRSRHAECDFAKVRQFYAALLGRRAINLSYGRATIAHTATSYDAW